MAVEGLAATANAVDFSIRGDSKKVVPWKAN